MIKVKFLEDLEITSWNYDGSFFRFFANKYYKIPEEIARELQSQGYCTLIEES